MVWALWRQGVPVVKGAGSELAWSVLRYAAAHQGRVALVGSAPAVMDELRQNLPQRLPGLNLVKAVDGFQPNESLPGLEAALRELNPDLVLIALGVPRQETWSQRVCQGASGVWMGVGGSFDVWAGVKRRAPAWMCRWQIEWLYRLLQEPSRWRRMLSLPAFAWDAASRSS